MLIIPMHSLYQSDSGVIHVEVVFSRGSAYVARNSATLHHRTVDGDLDYDQAEMATRLDLSPGDCPTLSDWVSHLVADAGGQRFLVEIEDSGGWERVVEILLPVADRVVIISRHTTLLATAHHSSGFKTGVILGSFHPNLPIMRTIKLVTGCEMVFADPMVLEEDLASTAGELGIKLLGWNVLDLTPLPSLRDMGLAGVVVMHPSPAKEILGYP